MDSKSRFKDVRKHSGLSMHAFGEKIGLSASGVSAIEYGTRALNEKHIKLICAAFPDINEEWLRTGNGDMLKQPPCPEQDAIDRIVEKYASGRPMLRALAETYLRLDEPHREAFDKILSAFIAAYQPDPPSSGGLANKDAPSDTP